MYKPFLILALTIMGALAYGNWTVVHAYNAQQEIPPTTLNKEQKEPEDA